MQYDRFEALRFPSYAFDPATGVATFDYLLDGPEPLSFTETVELPVPATSPSPARVGAVRRVLDLLHVVAGVSYYKVAAPPRVLAPTPLPAEAAALFTAVYTKGLAEYAFRNDLPHVLDLVVEVPAPPPGGLPAPAVLDNADATPLSTVGGGKDSIVTLEVLRAGGFAPVPFSVNPNKVINEVNQVSGLPTLAARRRLDPRLFELNAAGARNGHIPVTAINSLIAVATAVLHGLGPVVMSNERSASDPNLSWHGHPVNHQWSKGLEAEELLRAAVRVHVGLTEPYFSLLRSMSELHIAQVFARFSAYDAVVTSCNQAFRLHDPTARWCGQCPKCRFVFLALAPFVDRERLVGIVGRDLLADPSQVPGYLALLGIDAHKPFECVGEVEESLVALGFLGTDPQWGDAAGLAEVRAAVPVEAWAAASAGAVLTPTGPNAVPPAYAKALAEVIGSPQR